MKKKFLRILSCFVLLLLIVSIFAGCGPCKHEEIENISAVAATCTDTGLAAGVKCKNCGIILTEQISIPKTPHEFGNPTVTIPATCFENGTQEYPCIFCDYKKSEEIPSGHKYDQGTVIKPTCTNAGSTEYKCSACLNVKSEAGEPPLNHTYQDATCTTPKKCTVCGATSGEALGHLEDARCFCSRCQKYIDHRTVVFKQSFPLEIKTRWSADYPNYSTVILEKKDFYFEGDNLYINMRGVIKSFGSLHSSNIRVRVTTPNGETRYQSGSGLESVGSPKDITYWIWKCNQQGTYIVEFITPYTVTDYPPFA